MLESLLAVHFNGKSDFIFLYLWRILGCNLHKCLYMQHRQKMAAVFNANAYFGNSNHTKSAVQK